jgi:hypothetical protein
MQLPHSLYPSVQKQRIEKPPLLTLDNVKMEGDVDGEWCGDNSSNFLRVVAEVSINGLGVQSWAGQCVLLLGFPFLPRLGDSRSFSLFF